MFSALNPSQSRLESISRIFDSQPQLFRPESFPSNEEIGSFPGLLASQFSRACADLSTQKIDVESMFKVTINFSKRCEPCRENKERR